MALQQCNFVAPSANMLPGELASTPDIDAGDHQNLFGNMESKYHGSHEIPGLHSYTFNFTPSFSKSHTNFVPHHLGPLLLPAAVSNASELNSCGTESYVSINKNNLQAVGQYASPMQVSDFQSAGNTTLFAPVSSKPLGAKASRLPSAKIPRKAPLKANSRLPNVPRQRTGRKVPKPRQQRSTSRQETPVAAPISVQKRRRGANNKCRGSGRRSLAALQQAEEERFGGKMEDDQINDGSKEADEITGKTENHDKNASNTHSDTDESREYEQRIVWKETRSQAIKSKQSAQETSLSDSSFYRKRRPIYDYEVPLELEGIRKALGPDDWNEYVFLMESLWLHKVSAHEFDQGAKRIFHMSSNGMRKKMNSIILMKMIVPRIEEMHSDVGSGE
ncbi:hypothetical protein ACJQWK_08931 [Exserohilum turcicum]|uniref:Uncharacterized protein n=1 Tax=Exserohilum turcicum (strain 28A) TaxID=671987 RepID=R0KBF1_EXST2|nr:uncharacterized protein SETTUDRAFT_19227 [Exserohilum turcica Et28A]EOA86709.1 hypothetical protein SETTUDRAFT_19227 [Exserohilum turcica Et28A]